MRHKGGATSYLEILDSDTRYFIAQRGAKSATIHTASSNNPRDCTVMRSRRLPPALAANDGASLMLSG